MKQFIGLKKCVLPLSRVSHISLITDPVHLFIYFLFIQGIYSALFTNKRALMRCLTNRILIFTKKCSLKSKLIMKHGNK